ncbi:MAG TPA: hypothetical protein DCE42_11150 [Myxococcales bacterium]|nr:hypothetical protein [Myxococcales bacterium]
MRSDEPYFEHDEPYFEPDEPTPSANRKKRKRRKKRPETKVESVGPILQEGTITRITTQRKDPTRASVYIDGEFVFGLPKEVIGKQSLQKGQVLNTEAQKALIKADQLMRAKIMTLEYISYKPRTEHEVRKKLKGKEFAAWIINDVVARFIDLGYINDESYARAYVRSRLKNQGYGPQRIRMDLKKKGVAEDLVEQGLETYQHDDDALDTAKRHASRRWMNLLQKERDPRKRSKKLMDFLVRRGFDFETTRNILDEIKQQEGAAPSHWSDDMISTEEHNPAQPPPEEPVDEETLIQEATVLAEKRWRRLESEKNPAKRRKKLQEHLMRKGFKFDIIKQVTKTLEESRETEDMQEEELTPEEAFAQQQAEEEALYDEARRLAAKRWRKLQSEKSKAKRRKKLQEHLMRKGFRFDVIKPITEEAECGALDDVY